MILETVNSGESLMRSDLERRLWLSVVLARHQRNLPVIDGKTIKVDEIKALVDELRKERKCK